MVNIVLTGLNGYGETMETSGFPVAIEGEAYHAHHVEGCDTTMLRMKTAKGEELLYYATIVAEESKPAKFEVELAHAVARYPAGDEKRIEVTTDSGVYSS